MAATQREYDRKQQHDWLYPELLSKNGLLDILKQRYVSHSNLQSLEKEDLVELYYKYVIPLPQRKYKMNRRGREMTRKQIVLAKKRKIFAPADEMEPAKKKCHEDNTVNSRFITSFSDPSKGETRLKPPPSCIDFTKKTIKLGFGSKPSPTENKDSEKDTDSPPVKKKIKLITFSSLEISPTVCTKETSPAISPTVTSPTKKDVTINRNKTVSLINQHLTNSGTGVKEKQKTSPDKNSTTCESSNNSTTAAKEENVEKESSETSKPKKKIKIARIPWP